MASTSVPTISLNDGSKIPQLGLGVFQVPPEETFVNVTNAFGVGYRHIDTARLYANEAEVGQAVKSSGLSRADIFVTTKVANDDHGLQKAGQAIRESLGLLELDYIDLVLIHWPIPAHGLYVETWKALIAAREEGLVRSIGVSNFQANHLRDIIDATGVTPSVNQIELHPYLQQDGLRREHADRGIVTEAWSPLAQGLVLDDEVITGIAEAQGKSAGQVVLRWHLQLGNVVFPKSVTQERIQQNYEIFDFELGADEMEAIAALDRGERTGPDPDTFVRP